MTLLAVAARAQTSLPNDIITTSSELSGAQQRSVSQYVERFAPAIAGDAASERMDARKRLIAPLNAQGVSATFRLAYTTELIDDVRTWLGDDRVEVQYTALLIAGELATVTAANEIRPRLDAQDPTIRFGAAQAIGRTFVALSEHREAIGQAGVIELINAVAARIEVEQQTDVLDRVVRTLIEASEISPEDKPRLSNVSSTAHLQLFTRFGKRIESDRKAGKAGADLYIPTLRTLTSARSVVAAASLPSDEVALAAAGLTGDVLAFARDRVESGDLDDGGRAMLVRAVKGADNVLLFAGDALGSRVQSDAGDEIEKGTNAGDEAFVRAVDALVGPGGPLTQPPYRFSPDRFARP